MGNKHLLLICIALGLFCICSCKKSELTTDIRGTWKTDVVVTYDDGSKEYRTVYDAFASDGKDNNSFTEFVFGGSSIENASPESSYAFFSKIKGRWKIDDGDLYKEYDLSSLEVELGSAYQGYDKGAAYKAMFHHYKQLAENSKTPLKDLQIANMELSYDEGNIERTVFKKTNSIEQYIKPVAAKAHDTSVNEAPSAAPSGVPSSVKAILTSRIAEWDNKYEYDLESSVSSLYAQTVRFYGKTYSREDIQYSLMSLIEKYDDFEQDSRDIRFTQIDPVTVRCDFTKVTRTNSVVKNYPSYLYFQNINGVWLITQESDAVTDHNLSKKR